MVAGEPSGDLLAASLLDGLASRLPAGTQYYGIGGPRMIATGFDAHWPMEKLTVRGYVEALQAYSRDSRHPQRAEAAIAGRAAVGVRRRGRARFQLRARTRVARRGHSDRALRVPVHLGVARRPHQEDRQSGRPHAVRVPVRNGAAGKGGRRGDVRGPSARRRNSARTRHARRAPRAGSGGRRPDHRGVAGQPALGDRC